MTDLFFPPACIPAGTEIAYLDNSARFESPLSGAVRTVSRAGERLRLRLSFVNLSGAVRTALMAHVAALRGGQNRSIIPLHGLTKRGAFTATELLTNSTFASGTTGWTANNCAITSADRVLRLRPTAVTAWSASQAVSLTQYAPYALRSFIRDGEGTSALLAGRSLYLDSGIPVYDYSTARGLGTQAGVALSASSLSQFPVVVNSTSGYTGASYIETPYTSLARCALIDNGPNLLLQSDDISTTWTNLNSTESVNNATAPDGTVTGDNLVEDATAGVPHYITQSVTVGSAAAEYAFSVSLKSNARTWAALQINEATGGTVVTVYINLSTGALGASPATGVNWSNLRAFVVDQGSGWYRLTIVARKTNAATTLNTRIYTANADNGATYNGDGTSSIRVWRASLAQSSVPVRGVGTTAAAASGTAQSGTGLYLKGLPASTNGLLYAGDVVEIGGELVMADAALNSDASGLGYLKITKPLRTPSVENTPVIVGEPVGKFLLAGAENGWSMAPGGFSDFSLDFIEDIAA